MQKREKKYSGKKSFIVKVTVRHRLNVVTAAQSSDSSGGSANSKDG